MRTKTRLAALSVGILLVAGAAYWLPSERGQSVAPQTSTSSVRNVPAEVTTPVSSAAKPPAPEPAPLPAPMAAAPQSAQPTTPSNRRTGRRRGRRCLRQGGLDAPFEPPTSCTPPTHRRTHALVRPAAALSVVGQQNAAILVGRPIGVDDDAAAHLRHAKVGRRRAMGRVSSQGHRCAHEGQAHLVD
jgi:hypothetical protein